MECFAMQAMLYLKWPILDQASVYRASGKQISVCRRYLQNQDGLQVFEFTDKLFTYRWGIPENNWINIDQLTQYSIFELTINIYKFTHSHNDV